MAIWLWREYLIQCDVCWVERIEFPFKPKTYALMQAKVYGWKIQDKGGFATCPKCQQKQGA